MQSFFTYLSQWNKDTDRYSKMQYIYIILAISLLVVAGLVSLVFPNLGQSLVFLAGVSALVFVANGVIWAMVKTFVVPNIQAPKATSTRKKL